MSTEAINVAEIFGQNVFDDTVMQERLPKKIYKNLKHTIEEGRELDLETADVIAQEMTEWAIEKGATHYTHWFLHFVLIPERRLIRKHRFFVRWKRSIRRQCVCFAYSEIQLQRK